MGEHHVKRRAAARAAGFEQRRLKPSAMLVGAFEIHHGFVAAFGPAANVGQRRKALRIFQHERVRRAGIEPDIENIVDLLPVFVGELAEKTLARAGRVPGVGAFRVESVDDGGTDIGIVEDLDRAVLLVLDEQARSARPRRAGGKSPSPAGIRSCR